MSSMFSKFFSTPLKSQPAVRINQLINSINEMMKISQSAAFQFLIQFPMTSQSRVSVGNLGKLSMEIAKAPRQSRGV